MKILFRDNNVDVYDALLSMFINVPNVIVEHCDIFKDDPVADAIVSPANSYGYMDGGIDLAYCKYFHNSMKLQYDLQKYLKNSKWDGILPIGQAVVIPTGNKKIPNMISAPTMVLPGPVPYTQNAFKAFFATLCMAELYVMDSILCPGFCTLTGEMNPIVAAHQMRSAYKEYYGV